MTNPHFTPKMHTKALDTPTNEFERFVYIVSHDLNEPLRMMTSFMDLIDKKHGDSLPEEAQTYIRYCKENADKMKLMMRALVDYSRVGRTTEEITEIVLGDLMEDLFDMFSADLKLSNASVDYKNLPNAHAQPSLIIDLFKILFQNAFENKRSDHLHIKITSQTEGDYHEFCVEDNGKGIKSVYLDSVCEIFRKADKNTPNIGAGLAVAKAIVEKFGGQLRIDSIENKGTKVHFTLPT
ncbi:MAG: light-regulated signal transduction histidine kinase (bacteriophytochrome) [Flavobacteriales bacterium]|jgi:light-regulated signal transduction histidine kinase (bacteriophytochrome)